MLLLIFIILVTVALSIDLGIRNRRSHIIRGKEAIAWSFFWIAVSLLFNVFVYIYKGWESAVQFFTGYVVEKGLSVDNIFIFIVIFAYFQIPRRHQYRVLFLGILGAFAFRLIFILIGGYLVKNYNWILYVFGVFLFYLAYQLIRKDRIYNPEKSIILRLMKKIMPVTHDVSKGKFFLRKSGKWAATPLFFALILAEMADLVAALDSIPAIFVITTDPFIVYTSNILAMLGLRSLYFAVAEYLRRLSYLHYGLVGVLLFLAVKIFTEPFYKIPTFISFSIVLVIMTTAILASIWKKRSS